MAGASAKGARRCRPRAWRLCRRPCDAAIVVVDGASGHQLSAPVCWSEDKERQQSPREVSLRHPTSCSIIPGNGMMLVRGGPAGRGTDPLSGGNVSETLSCTNGHSPGTGVRLLGSGRRRRGHRRANDGMRGRLRQAPRLRDNPIEQGYPCYFGVRCEVCSRERMRSPRGQGPPRLLRLQ